MKTDIHPTYHQTKVQCACGNDFTVGSTKKELSVEICSECHPFYTGETNIVDSTGRVDRFKRIQEKTAAMSKKPKKKEQKKKNEKEAKDTLKDLKKK